MPSRMVNGCVIFVTGRWIEVATVLDENWAVSEAEDPGQCVEALKKSHLGGPRADSFTFVQKPPSTAVLPTLCTFSSSKPIVTFREDSHGFLKSTLAGVVPALPKCNRNSLPLDSEAAVFA